MVPTTRATPESPLPSNVSNLSQLSGKYVKVFLAARNVTLRGTLIGSDDDSIMLEDTSGRTVVYKYQIMSVVEATPPAV